MLATATGNCAVTSVTYNENKYYVVTWTVYLESSIYLRRRQWLAVHCQSLMSFITQTFSDSKPRLDLFPRKCTYAKVIDLRNMVLWSTGFIAKRYLIQGRSQDFSKGGGLKLWKQKLWKGKIACVKISQESTCIVDKQLTVLTTKPGVLPTKLPSCFSDILSWRPYNSTTLIACLSRVLLWSTIFFYCRKAYFSRPRFLHFCKV